MQDNSRSGSPHPSDAAKESVIEQLDAAQAGGRAPAVLAVLARLGGRVTEIEQIKGKLIILAETETNKHISDFSVILLGELIAANAVHIPALAAFAVGNDLARARFCHIAGYGGQNALRMASVVEMLAERDESAAVRRRAVQALSRLIPHGLKDAESIIRNALNDADESVRSEAQKFFRQSSGLDE